MHTPTHAVLSLAFDRGRYLGCWRALTLGAVLPDLPSILVSTWFLGVRGMAPDDLFGGLYQEAWFKLVLAPFHAIPVGLVLLGVALWRKARALEAFAVAFLVHALLDLPLHGEDAHAHFFPLSDVRIHSSLSYWDRATGAQVVAGLELVLIVGVTALVWRRYPRPAARGTLVVVAVGMVAAYAFGLLFWGT